MSAKDEINEMRAEHDALKGATLDSSRRALATIKTTEEVAHDTLTTLHSQGEQLSAIEQKSRQLDANTQRGHAESKKVKKKKKKIDKEFEDENKRIEIEAEKNRIKKRDKIIKEQLKKEERTKKQIQSREQQPQETAEEPKSGTEIEFDRNLREISNVTRNLGRMARDMSDELDDQKINISKIQALNTHAEKTLERAEVKIKKYS